ncbi:MAG: hypothetical protein P0Y53_05445 [Candidatus Pseudobacter hemicellulosilyticus]|uniref:Uncharacterized protein n=1 Tax=Candidatus Pseudobacter hemicellulosilyticus TaxID=3121375 RepID=A0AAJ5WUD6_9BACT|nr:MAG: hypothetical protein P0Y53_05445 [Pseudobacter sp.]
MAIKMVIVVVLLTWFLDSRLREVEAAGSLLKTEAADADSAQTDHFFDTAIFADKMQSTVFQVRQ